jgi:hypothetical protein
MIAHRRAKESRQLKSKKQRKKYHEIILPRKVSRGRDCRTRTPSSAFHPRRICCIPCQVALELRRSRRIRSEAARLLARLGVAGSEWNVV